MRGCSILGILAAAGFAGVALVNPSAGDATRPGGLRDEPTQLQRAARTPPHSDVGVSLRDQARATLERSDDTGCRLEPLRDAFFADDARYVVHFRLPEDDVRALEMSGAEHKAFAIDLARDLGFSKLNCINVGRFYHVDGTTVHVREQRLIDAVYKGEDVAVELTWDMLIGPAAGGAMQVKAISGYMETR